ncbi:MAG: N-6 DNA methylase, partial [Synergistaceae bacterium]|nr:N-6 DNA methylase [Synergistaceae bacterium]
MHDNEANFDLYIHDLLTEAKIDASYQGTTLPELNDALATASKSQTGEIGRPDYVAVVKDFVLVIENKAERDKLCLREPDGSISLTPKATRDYALNGALFYAKKIIEGSNYKKVFAFGNAGDRKHHTLKPIFAGVDDEIVELDEIETFENFSHENIEKFYRYRVKGETPPEQKELADIEEIAGKLNNYLRNYGGLGNTEKPLVVSAILLALTEKRHGFMLNSLIGDVTYTDGEKLYKQLDNSLRRANIPQGVKLTRVEGRFDFIRTNQTLNTLRKELQDSKNPDGKTPLKFFAEFIEENVYKNFSNLSPEDYIGRFYMEFIRYTGGDAQSLGIVITPRHITELFCDLVKLKPDDVIFDPCCGTGGFLIAGMHRLLKLAENETLRKNIKTRQIYGIELSDDMFAMATASMILHGDGQSNITCEDFLKTNASSIQLKGITVGFMNPPYSMAKQKQDAGLSELSFTEHLLKSVVTGGRVAVIVPVSTMIGKTREDKQKKIDILKHHTLEGVISLNKNTFYGVGTVPCIAVFTAGEPHQPEKLVKFINFEDDGWEVKMHQGLIETERAKDRRQYLLDCWNGTRKDFPSSFMVETTIEASDEWLHSFY